MATPVTEYDIIFLSYDEPNKEHLWSTLLNQCPWAKRVDGVKGFDSAHKACAELSDTEWFISVDGDNTVDAAFFDQEVEVDDKILCYSWRAKNMTNGLTYGNGGLKLWNKSGVLNMKTHENAEDEHNEVDFCWEGEYVQLNNLYSFTHINGSDYQSFRAGFREGIKLSLDRGNVLKPYEFKRTIHHLNYKRLCIWATVGRDVKHGDWAIYGTRLAMKMLMLDEWDYTVIRDYDWFENFWNEIRSKNLLEENMLLLERLKSSMQLDIACLDENGSKFFKTVYENPIHMQVMQRENV